MMSVKEKGRKTYVTFSILQIHFHGLAFLPSPDLQPASSF